MAWLPDGEKISKISLFILTECTDVTDTHTTWWHRPRLHSIAPMQASRGKNQHLCKWPHYITLHIFKLFNNVMLYCIGTWTPFNPETVRLMIGELWAVLWSRPSRQREQLHASGLSICSSVCLFVCRQSTKMQFSQKLSNLELWCLLTTYRKSYMGYSKNPLFDPYNPRWLRYAILKIDMTLFFLLRVVWFG